MSQDIVQKLSEMFLLPIEVVKGIIALDADGAMEKAMLERMLPSQINQPNLYEIRLDGHSSQPDEMTIQYYDRFDPSLLKISEDEGDIRKHDSYSHYINLSKSGSEPPPITVVKHSSGSMVSINRRRVLVAQELKKDIGGWVESDTAEFDSTLTLGAFNEAKCKIINENNVDLELLTSLGFDVSRVWFHGTGADFDSFDVEKFGSNEPRGDYIGKALFYAADYDTALKYAVQAGGNKVMRVFLKISNCLHIPDTGLDLSFYDGINAAEILKPSDYEAIKNHPHINKFAHLFMEQSERAEFFKSKGYDGFIEEKSKQAAVLTAEQVFILPPDFKLDNKMKTLKLKM